MRQIPYPSAGGRTLFLHVSAPPVVDARAAPVGVFFHGGGWVKGSWRQFRPQAARLTALGMLAVLVEYRTEGPVAATEDAVAAMNAVFEKAPGLGGDPGRVVAIGGSAGGHLALATTVLDLPNTNPEHRPSALVLLNPVTKTTGEFPDGFGRRHFADDDQALRYSPLRHVGAGMPPVLVMHGTADTAVHHENSVEFVEKVKLLGGHAEIVLYPGQRHGFFNPRDPASRDGDGSYFDRTTREMIRFVRAVTRQEGS
ncbi:alpha/beta hydrolase [Actinophytocola gossypii]|uniref:Alpha/beta hydrolase fold domain-containing protein n=1 Tax=Actinophytocola gossypii TaxID=2812003 RepID=A0ABT2JBY9_9PSEU|nr:alpha/beta hydrolase [Actinophytocola gossypii]MCT2584829.1 alpha/beta hydrolase fold domain-containing protein [Actinophytocola gossypii]